MMIITGFIKLIFKIFVSQYIKDLLEKEYWTWGIEMIYLLKMFLIEDEIASTYIPVNERNRLERLSWVSLFRMSEAATGEIKQAWDLKRVIEWLRLK
jgi:hypothetical protein